MRGVSLPHSVFLQLVVGVQVRCGREAASRPGTRGVLARARGTRERGRKIRNAHERGRLRTGLPWNTNGGGGNTNAQEHEQESMNTSTQENERGRQKRRTPRNTDGLAENVSHERGWWKVLGARTRLAENTDGRKAGQEDEQGDGKHELWEHGRDVQGPWPQVASCLVLSGCDFMMDACDYLCL